MFAEVLDAFQTHLMTRESLTLLLSMDLLIAVSS